MMTPRARHPIYSPGTRTEPQGEGSAPQTGHQAPCSLVGWRWGAPLPKCRHAHCPGPGSGGTRHAGLPHEGLHFWWDEGGLRPEEGP